MNVIKRDGRVTDFNENKIINAIQGAFMEVDGSITEDATTISVTIAESISKKAKDLTVENIQDIVERQLMASKRKDVAKAYIIYRNERTKARDNNSNLIKKVLERTTASNVENANANVDENSFSGREKEASADIQKFLALDLGGLSEPVATAHKEMLVYQHDLDKAVIGQHNCLNLDFGELFKNGFVTRNGDVRPPSSFSTACQLVAVAFQCQSQVQFGGVGSIHLDYDLAPFVTMSFEKHFLNEVVKGRCRMYPSPGVSMEDHMKALNKRKKEYKKQYIDAYNSISLDNEELRDGQPDYYYNALFSLEEEGSQAAQGLYHNLNTLESRAGGQVPFTSINLGRNTSTEGRLVTKWIMNASLDGIGKHHLTSIFPISIFQYKPGTNANPEDPNYDLKQLALKSMSKRIYPNWCNGNWSQAHENESNPDTFFSTMGCRTLIGHDRHGLDYIRQGRGNNVPNTIILPKLGIEYGICLGDRTEADLDGFWKAFEEALKLAEKGLLERFALMIKESPEAAPFMYKNKTIKGTEDCTNSVYEALRHNSLAIGYIGIAEMCVALFGENHVHNTEAHEFSLSVVKRIYNFCIEASERNDLNFSCYATPAEGLCSTSVQSLRKQYGLIEGITDRDYLTNSHHVPVWEKVSMYDKLNLEAPFCKYATGGCITYLELESTFIHNLKAVEDIIDYAFNELDIPYLAFNFPIDTCTECGYQDEIKDDCPRCHSRKILRLRRVTGYITVDFSNFNKGKIAEVKDRVKHSSFTKYELKR